MSQDLITKEQGSSPMFGRNGLGAAVNQGAVAIEQERAIAEAQGQLMLAKRFPRDENAAFAKLMIACKEVTMAEVAFYSLPRGKQTVTGPSIRLAEEIARVYGNFQYGHRELSRDHEKSEIEVFAWDMENNNRSIRQITVFHVMDTKEGPRKLRDQKDIDDKIANVASKQVRGRILALVPKWLSEAAIAECRKTLETGGGETIQSRVRKMTQVFAKYGVTNSHLEAYMGHSLDNVTSDELTDLTGIFNAIKDGRAISEFFGNAEAIEGSKETAQALTQAAQEGNQQRKQAAAKVRQPAKEKTAAETPANTQKPEPDPQSAAVPAAAGAENSNSDESLSNNMEEEAPEDHANSSPADDGQGQAEPPAGDGSTPEKEDVF